MELTRVERWILVNQYRILETLYENEREELSLARRALDNGFELEYESIIPLHPQNESLDCQQCQLVVDILEMFRALRRSYDSLSEEERDGITENAITFQGFDGNNETEEWAYCIYLRDQGRWQESLQDSDCNSHTRLLDHYCEMLMRWKSLPEQWCLNRQHIFMILGMAE